MIRCTCDVCGEEITGKEADNAIAGFYPGSVLECAKCRDTAMRIRDEERAAVAARIDKRLAEWRASLRARQT